MTELNRRLPWQPDTLRRLAHATRALRDNGIAIQRQNIDGERPEIEIDRDPGALTLLGGVTGQRQPDGRRSYRTRLCGCDIIWQGDA